MADDIKKVGLELTAKGAEEFKQSLKEVASATKEAYSELKLAQSQYDKNTSATDKLKDRQKYLAEVTEQYGKKAEILAEQLKELESAENRDEVAINKKRSELNQCNAKLNDYKKSLEDVNNKLKTHSEQLKEWGDKLQAVGDKMTEVGKGLTMKVTAPLAAVGGVGVKKFAEVDKTMQLTNKTMGNTAEQADLLNRAMKDAAANSTFGMSDAANATLNFARAGLDAEQAAATLAPAMNLAAGEGGNLDTVSAGLVATINGFHGSFDEAGNYADVFAAACNNSALDIDSLSNAMSVAAPIFSSAGYSVNDAALYMGVMANNGIDADKAANSLKTGLARLVSPAKQGAEMMDKLGISVTNSDGTMKDSVQIQQELHDAFSNLSESEQIAAASAIFGKNQMAPWLALINTAPADVQGLNNDLSGASMTIDSFSKALGENGLSLDDIKARLAQLGISGEAVDAMFQTSNGDAGLFAEGLLECANSGVTMDDVVGALGGSLGTVQEAMNNTKGTTDEMAESMMSGFGGSLEKLKSSIDVAATSLGEALAPTIQKVADFIQGLVDKFNSLDPAQQQMIATIGLVVAAIGPVLVILGTVISTVGTIMTALGGLSLALGAPLLAPIGIAVGVIAGLVAAGVLLYKNWDKITATAKNLATGLKQKWSQIQEDVGKAARFLSQDVPAKFKGLANDVISDINGLKDGAKQKFDDVRNGIVDKATALKDGAVEKITGLKDGALQGIEDLRTSAMQKVEDLKSGAIEKIQGLKDGFDERVSAIGDKVRNTFEGVKNFIEDPLESAKNFVHDAIENIKDSFDFELKFPDIKLPHLNIWWEEIAGWFSIPHVDVDWYAKAYEEPWLFTNPTVLGKYGFGDRPGGEIVYGHESLMRDIEEAVKNAGSQNRTFAPVINVYGNGKSDQELADEISNILMREYLLQRGGA